MYVLFEMEDFQQLIILDRKTNVFVKEVTTKELISRNIFFVDMGENFWFLRTEQQRHLVTVNCTYLISVHQML